MTLELIHPPHYNSTDDRLDPPLGLLMIASSVSLYYPDVEIRVTDLSGTMPGDEWQISKSDIYGTTVYAPTLSITKQIIQRCREMNPEATTVVGGAHPTALPDTFRGLVDHVIVGYGEMAMVDLIGSYTKPAFNIKGDYLSNCFLMPRYDLSDVNSYSRRIGDRKSLPILTTRGCPYRCSFCGLSNTHNIETVKFAKPEAIIEQVARIKDEYGIHALNIQDDIFTLNKKKLFRLLDMLKPLDVRFRCMGRAGYDTEEVYERLAEAGCVGISWGIESGSQKMLDGMNKQTAVEDNYNVIQWGKKYGIDTRAFFILGFPGETKETLEETKRFIMRADPDQYFLSNFVPYPGTAVWNGPEEFGITNMSYDFDQYYQVSKDGTGGSIIDTVWLKKEEFKELELEFRNWMARNKPLRGRLQEYEKGLLLKKD